MGEGFAHPVKRSTVEWIGLIKIFDFLPILRSLIHRRCCLLQLPKKGYGCALYGRTFIFNIITNKREIKTYYVFTQPFSFSSLRFSFPLLPSSPSLPLQVHSPQTVYCHQPHKYTAGKEKRRRQYHP